MSVELEYNGNRYMVDGGKWYRRLEVGEKIPSEATFRRCGGWIDSISAGYVVMHRMQDDYRVPCTDPRLPFTVGQRVRVARKDESWCQWVPELDSLIGLCLDISYVLHDGRVEVDAGFNSWHLPPWCLDPVEPSELLDELAQQAQELGMYEDTHNPAINRPSIGEPCLPWILSKLSRQPAKADRTREILQRCMSELVRLESEN